MLAAGGNNVDFNYSRVRKNEQWRARAMQSLRFSQKIFTYLEKQLVREISVLVTRKQNRRYEKISHFVKYPGKNGQSLVWIQLMGSPKMGMTRADLKESLILKSQGRLYIFKEKFIRATNSTR